MADPPEDLSTPQDDLSSPVVAGLLSMASTTVPVLTGFFMMSLREDPWVRGGSPLLWAGLIVMNTGVAVGPSIGHLYAGEVGRGVGMMALRTLGAWGATGLVIGGAETALDSNGIDGAAGFMVTSGAVLGVMTLGLMVWDLVDAPAAARRANAESEADAVARAWVPRVRLGPNGGAAQWTF